MHNPTGDIFRALAQLFGEAPRVYPDCQCAEGRTILGAMRDADRNRPGGTICFHCNGWVYRPTSAPVTVSRGADGVISASPAEPQGGR